MSRVGSRLSRDKTVIAVSEKRALNEGEEQELKEAFDLFDEDASGTLGKRELHVVMQAIGRNMEMSEVEANIRRLKQESQTEGGDNNGPEDELNQEEFIHFISQMQQDTVTEELKEAYRKFCGSDDTDLGFSREQLQKTMEE